MPASSVQQISRDPYRVLIVDDEAVHRTLCRRILREPEYSAREARSGAEALELLREQEFDLVLIDKRMPDIDGDEVCRLVRGQMQRSLLPIIMITGSCSQEDLVSSLQAGATDFIRKPYRPTELQARARAAANYKRLTDQLDSAESMLFALARMVEARDEGTGDHCGRLMHMAGVFGTHLDLRADELTALQRGAVLHDIGKLCIPDSILLKRGPLTETDWIVMRQHTVIGERLVSAMPSMRLTAPIIRSHHERWDGSGYPDGLRGEEIPRLARIFQVLDTYDALASARPYKPAFERAKVIEIMRQELSKGWRDPVIAGAFLDIVNSRPEDLVMPLRTAKTADEEIFDEIVAAGILEARKQPVAA